MSEAIVQRAPVSKDLAPARIGEAAARSKLAPRLLLGTQQRLFSENRFADNARMSSLRGELKGLEVEKGVGLSKATTRTDISTGLSQENSSLGSKLGEKIRNLVGLFKSAEDQEEGFNIFTLLKFLFMAPAILLILLSEGLSTADAK